MNSLDRLFEFKTNIDMIPQTYSTFIIIFVVLIDQLQLYSNSINSDVSLFVDV